MKWDGIDWLFAIGTLVSVFMILLATFGRQKRDGSIGVTRSGRAHRRYKHANARIISDTEIEITNLDDVDMWNMDRWHVSMLKSVVNMGGGTRRFVFDKPMGVRGTQSEHMMYMREALGSIQDHLDTVVNPEKDRAE